MFKKLLIIPVAIVAFFVTTPAFAAPSVPEVPRTNIIPLMERYILDDLKAIRTEMERNRADLVEKIADKELKVAADALNYSNSTVMYFFYLIATVGVLFALVGWSSLKDVKSNMKTIAEKEINRIAKMYEVRLTNVEKELRDEGEKIIENQQEIEKMQEVHFLWWKAEIEKDNVKRLQLYNQILAINPESSESYVKKSHVNLMLGNFQDAVTDADNALELTGDYSTAYYNRACANAQMGNIEEALEDLQQSFYLNESFKESAAEDEMFEPISKKKAFKELIK